MRIYTDENGVAVNALSGMRNGLETDGHYYQFLSNDLIREIHFQLGPVKEHGVNGATTEAVLTALIHRIEVMNKTSPCRENSIAITKMQEALMWLDERTKDRTQRGVEGSNQS